MAELAKQDSTVSSLSIPPAFATMLGTYRLEESDKFEEFMQVTGHPVRRLKHTQCMFSAPWQPFVPLLVVTELIPSIHIWRPP